ncbi:DUF2971 domain-containing protein [Pseudomonas sp. DTU12.3]|uniref:DUF2971 domain-containing protein n=1 Tax=Pseudomonas sp. DTU12.3 TaxID=2073078 RepID=UPI0013E916D5|nr:DUF2971 domain-containing protein [Pseudomonas sp. DTU12.3]
MLSYKYRAINKYSLDILNHNSVYFSKYTDFNDPFELSTPFPNLARMYTRASAELDQLHKSGIFSSEIYQELKNICAKIIKNGNPKLDETHKKIRERMSRVGIYSLSQVNNEILMWSHYADNHKGFCIGFESLHLNTIPLTKKLPVNYKTTFTDLDDPKIIINFYTEVFHNLLHLPENEWQAKREKLAKKLKHEDDQRGGLSVLTDKYEKWSYEQEVRLIDQKNFGLKQFDPKCIKSITFGLRADPKDVKEIQKICRETNKEHITFYKTEKHDEKFELNIVELHT